MSATDEVTLVECPAGLFWSSNGELCVKTEYSYPDSRVQAYIVRTGEFFWGAAPQTVASQRASLVRPLDYEESVSRLAPVSWHPVPRSNSAA